MGGAPATCADNQHVTSVDDSPLQGAILVGNGQFDTAGDGICTLKLLGAQAPGGGYGQLGGPRPGGAEAKSRARLARGPPGREPDRNRTIRITNWS